MIYGLGTDIVEVDRIEAAWRRHGIRFAERVLGPEERAKFQARLARVESRGIAFLATRWAAKEAISKAVGLGMRMPMSWQAVQILNDRSGKPRAVANGALAAFLQERGLELHVTLSDEKRFAVAFAIAEHGNSR
ncbi:holo-ACP synthase [soil metagenome]